MPPTNPRGQHPPADDFLENLYEQVHDYTQRYWRHVLVVVLAIIVVLMGYQSYTTRLRTEEAQTWNQISDLPALNQLMFRRDREKQHQQIIDSCKKMLSKRWQSGATPWVLLKLANVQLAADRLGAARETLDRLNRDYPNHYATGMATKTRAALLEDMRRYEEAANLYAKLARNAGEGSPLWVDAGRARELAGDKDGAIEAYAEVVEATGQENGAEFPRAGFRYDILNSGGPLLPPPPEPPAAPEPSQTGEGAAPGGLTIPPAGTTPPAPAPPEESPEAPDRNEPETKTESGGDSEPETTSDEG